MPIIGIALIATLPVVRKAIPNGPDIWDCAACDIMPMAAAVINESRTSFLTW